MVRFHPAARMHLQTTHKEKWHDSVDVKCGTSDYKNASFCISDVTCIKCLEITIDHARSIISVAEQQLQKIQRHV